MPYYLDPDGGTGEMIVLSRAEWRGLTGSTITDSEPITSERLHRDYETAASPDTLWCGEPVDVPALVRAFIDAGLGGSDVPPTDLIGKVRSIGQARRAAEHQARTLAGEVAALRERLDTKLPAIFDTVVAELADLLPTTDDAVGDITDVAGAALRVTLRLLDEYEVRIEPDVPRPVGCACDPSVLAQGFLGSPSDGAVWTCPHGRRWRGENGSLRPETDAEFYADHPLPFPTGAFVDAVRRPEDPADVELLTGTPAERAVDPDPSPAFYSFGPDVHGLPEIVTYDQASGQATSLWGIPLDSNHPSVAHIADNLEAAHVEIANCDTLDCRREHISKITRVYLQGVEMSRAGHNRAVDIITTAIMCMSMSPTSERGVLHRTVREALTYTTIFPSRAST